jgi:hypothetical protein
MELPCGINRVSIKGNNYVLIGKEGIKE